MNVSQVKYILITDKPAFFQKTDDLLVMTTKDFINAKFSGYTSKVRPKIINISNNYEYMGKGYYVSLLAEARGLPCIPSVSNILALAWKRHYEFALPELNALLQKNFKAAFEEPLTRTYTSFFGRHDDPGLEAVSSRLFDLFRFPLISFEVKCAPPGKWVIGKIDTPSFATLTDPQVKPFHKSLAKFTGSAWRNARSKKPEKYWIAILHDPNEKHAPSNKVALNKFISVGKKMGLAVELVTKQDFSTLLEFDALFIRETTAINNHTYRFAYKAEQENIPCIDDTSSIIRCCNKVYLKELLETLKIPTPRTLILERTNIKGLPGDLSFPMVLKIPDSSFSRGVTKVENLEALKEKSTEIFQKSDLILCQEFVPSTYDWRIGVLGNKPLFASKYYMAENHWQVYNSEAKSKKKREGKTEAVPLEDVPEEIVKLALAATKPIGNSLYGVDIKQLEDGRVVVIEVNDNPNVDNGIEDVILGDAVYRKILNHIVTMIET
ncbi:MAG: RimK family protein [Alphaproteobacteria bacterium]|nr:RimK family protein [Alphaproteobacteria bacterium]MCB9975381.1 RimK family protein [Rhodospirillales bacterium]